MYALNTCLNSSSLLFIRATNASYYVENNHEAIIDAETFEMVQRELARRTKGKNRHSGVHLLSGRIKCGDCGGWYGSKVWHSPEKCKRTVWQCNQKYKNEVRCKRKK